MANESGMSVDELIARAVAGQRSGDFGLAESCYRAVLDITPGNDAVRYLLSQVAGTSSDKFETDFLRSVFSRYQSHYSAVLPYNLNWILRETSPIDAFLRDNPIIVYDVGARGDDLGELVGLKRHIKYYAFDADEEECRRINGSPPLGFNDFKIFPHFLGGDSAWTCFHLYKSRACSSKYEPGKKYKARFSPGLDVEKTIAMKCDRLDDVVDTYKLDEPDLIKIDTQGTELEILQGGRGTLDSALLVELEVEFVEMYEGQPTFNIVDKFMNENGFQLLYLNRFFQQRYRYHGQSRGQLIFGDALYGRTETLDKYSAARLAKYAVLLINYGHVDFAYDIFLDYPEVREKARGLASWFSDPPNNQQKLETMALDKLICSLLHQRKTNCMPIDSDRSWPIR